MELYERQLWSSKKIDNIREWEEEAQYTLQSIASEMMDETYSETRKPIPTLIKRAWFDTVMMSASWMSNTNYSLL